MAHALPVAKLAGLFIKTLSKPLSKRIKHEFSRNATTQEMLVRIGQVTHVVTTKLTVFASGYKIMSIKPLESEEAQKRGAEFLGESIVFLTAGGVIIGEHKWSKAKDKIKEDKKHDALQQDADELQRKLRALNIRLQALEKVVKANTQSRLNFGQRYVEPEEVKVDMGSTPIVLSKIAGSPIGNNTDGTVPTSTVEQSDSTQEKSEETSSTQKTQGWWGWIITPLRRENRKS